MLETISTALPPGNKHHHMGSSTVDGGEQAKMARRPAHAGLQTLVQEQQRLHTFASWPTNAPIAANKLARAGFYYTGQGLQTKCFHCGVEHSGWVFSDSAMGKHRELSPNCEFVLSSLGESSGGCSAGARRTSEPDLALMQRSEDARLQTFANWPVDFLQPRELAQAGFYYLQQDDMVRCAFCQGVIHNWERGEVPLREHGRHFPCCPFLLNPSMRSSMDVCGRFSSFNEVLSGPEKRAIASQDSAHVPLTRFGIAPHSAPKHTALVSPDARLRSFEEWPSDAPVRPHDLVKAGFFYIGLNDYTKCFHCDGGLCNWETGDDPWVEHARWFPGCEFVRLNKGVAFIKECSDKQKSHFQAIATTLPQSSEDPNIESEMDTLMQSPDVLFYVEQGVPLDILRNSLRAHIASTGRGFSSREELTQVLNSMFSLNTARLGDPSNSKESRGSPAKATADKNTVQIQCDEQRNGRTGGGASDTERLELENLRLKDERLCKICLDAEVGVVFLPCGHLVACPACAASVKDCPICRKTIMGSVRTFLS
ncbi:baculoviral IAP repeat-containing protein 7-like [Ornithodoros turicata]|uniref:baculoviral IAP repeat-containing protein 7-like n=1 Tax=Ornithodoros turicata TaxID=34597 RepID=UPI003139A83A